MNRLDYYFRQLLSEAELDKGFKYAEDSDLALAKDNALVGIQDGLVVAPQLVPDMTVAVSAGVAYTKDGKRVASTVTLPPVNIALDFNNVPTAVAAAGNEKYVAVFIDFDRALTDPRTDGNSNTVFFERSEFYKIKIVQSAEALVGFAVPVAPDSTAIRLADVRLTFGQATVTSGSILTRGREDVFTDDDWVGPAPAPLNLRAGTPQAAFRALQTALNTLINGGGPNFPASSVDYNGGPNWADGGTNPATDVELQLDKIVGDLRATTAPAGAVRVGARGQTAGLLALSGATVDAQLGELLGLVAAAGAATGVSYAGGPAWANGSTNPATSVEFQLDKIIGDLASFAAGSALIGAGAIASTPDSLSNNVLSSQIAQLLGFVNGRGRLASPNTWNDENAYDGAAQTLPLVTPLFRIVKDASVSRQLVWEQSVGPTFWFRMYSEPTGSLLLTWNAKWSGIGNTWTKDSAVAPIFLEIGPTAPFFSLRRYVSTGTSFSTATGLAGEIELTPGDSPFASPPKTVIDGSTSVLRGPGLVTTHAQKAAHAAVLSSYIDTYTFPKRFPAAPSSVTITTNASTNIASLLPFADASSFWLNAVPTATGVFAYNVDVDAVLVQSGVRAGRVHTG